MKKVLIYFLIFLLICFIIPALLTKGAVNGAVQKEEKDKNEEVGQTRNHANSLSCDPSCAINFK